MGKDDARSFKFTKAAIEKLPVPAAGRVEYTDTEIRALRLRVTAAGSKTFSALIWVTAERKLERLTIGKFPAVSVDAARDSARRHQGKVASGENPADQRRKYHDQATLGEAFEAYLEHRMAAGIRRGADIRASWERYLGTMPVAERKKHSKAREKPEGGVDWSDRKLSELTHERIKKLYDSIVATGKPTTANRVHEIIRATLNHAGVSPNPADGIKRIATRARKRFMSKPEIGRFLAAVDAAPQPWRDYFTVLLFVGYRRSAVAAMRWADVDLDRRTWRVPGESAKNGEPIVLPLAGGAFDAIQRRAQERAKAKLKSAWVFPGGGVAGHISRPKHAWAAVLKAAKIDDLHVHDLRRTLGSWMALQGVSLLQIANALGHRDPRSAQVYAHLNDDAARAAVERAHEMFVQPAKVAP